VARLVDERSHERTRALREKVRLLHDAHEVEAVRLQGQLLREPARVRDPHGLGSEHASEYGAQLRDQSGELRLVRGDVETERAVGSSQIGLGGSFDPERPHSRVFHRPRHDAVGEVIE